MKHTPTWQHSMESESFVWVWYIYMDPYYSSAQGSQGSWFKATSEHSELCSTALCAAIAGPQLSVAISSHSPTGSTAASKILLSRWVSETVVVITLHSSLASAELRSSVWALSLSLWEPTPSAGRRSLCHPRAPQYSSSLLAAVKYSSFASTVQGSYLSNHVGTAQCPSSSATPQGLGQLLGPQANWTLGKKLQQRPAAYWAAGAETARRPQHSLDPI